MPRAQPAIYALNAGEVGREAISRLDLERLRFAGELYQNIFPKVIGSIQLRGGLGYKADSAVNEAGNLLVPFVVGTANNAVLQFSSDGMRIFDGDNYLSRASVSTTITNGDFAAFTGWTDESTGSASATATGGQLVLTGASGSLAIARQEVSISGVDDTVEHGLNLEIANGPINLTIGTTAGGTEILSFARLDEGSHRLAFTPGDGVTSVFIDIINEENRIARVESALIAPAGQIVVNHPWGVSDFAGLKYDQSSDVIFVASGTFQQRMVERRGITSWSVVRYRSDNGPFDVLPDENITIAPSATTGTVTLTSSASLFLSEDVGSLFRLQHFSQFISETLTTAGQVTEPIRVTGVTGAERNFNWIVDVSSSPVFSGTVVLERAFTEPLNYTEFQTRTTDSSNFNFFDQEPNRIVFYRFRLGTVTQGTADVTLDYGGGVTQGIARIVSVTNGTTATAEVLSPFGSTDATNQWDRGSWSDRNGWPSSATFFDGRLWWGRGDIVYGSVSDDFDNFSDEIEGDSAPVIRSIGTNTADGILWLLGLQRLAAGTTTEEVSIRASSFDEPITPSNFVPRTASTRGSADVAAIEIDSEGFFAHRSGERLYRYTFTPDKNDYFAFDMTEMHREILAGGIKRIGVQRHPDTRIWVLLNTGELRCLVYELDQNVIAWTRIVTDGTVEDFTILPSTGEDRLFIIANRTINAVTQRYIEEMAPLTDAIGGASNAIADSYITGTNAPASTTISGLSHLEGEQVIVWADGVALHDQSNMLTVTSGSITVSTAVTNWMVGLPYVGRWTSTKLAYGSGLGTALTQRKRISHLGLVMENVAPDGIRIGKDFNSLQRLRPEFRGRPLTPGEFFDNYDYDASQFGGGWNTDARVNIEMRAPYPATVSAMVLHMKTNDYGG